VKDFADLKAKFKNNATFASSAVGTGMHLEGLELNSFWKINGSHVPYKDLGLSFVDTSNGLITYTFTTIASSRQLEQSGKLKYIAYANTTRNPDYPNLPTLAEVTGKPLTLYHSWNIVYVKKAIPADIKAKIANDVTEIMKSPALQQQLKAIGYNPLNGTPDDLEKFVNTDTTNFEKATKKYKISVE
jgi:tripartite-type tricarboxylate transporter receptor subunit TctC